VPVHEEPVEDLVDAVDREVVGDRRDCVVPALDVDPVHGGLLRHPPAPEADVALPVVPRVGRFVRPVAGELALEFVEALAEPLQRVATLGRAVIPLLGTLPEAHARDLVRVDLAGVHQRLADRPARAGRYVGLQPLGRHLQHPLGVGPHVLEVLLRRHAAILSLPSR
jgi:hypothetical protein